MIQLHPRSLLVGLARADMLRHRIRPAIGWAAILVAAPDAYSQSTTRESVAFNAIELAAGGGPESGVSLDGRYVCFSLPIAAPSFVQQVLVRDHVAGVDILVSASPQGTFGDSDSSHPAMTANGRWVAFQSTAQNLVGSSTGAWENIFVRDMQSTAMTWESFGVGGAAADGFSERARISPDGRFVVFDSAATNLVAGDVNGFVDIFVRDRLAQTTTLASVGALGQANQDCFDASISDDGRYAVFASFADNLVSGDTNGTLDVFLRDRVTQTTSFVDLTASGQLSPSGAEAPVISGNGRFVVFFSRDNGIVAGDSNFDYDGFIRDRLTNTNELLSVSVSGGFGGGTWREPAVSPDGRFVAFVSQAADLVIGDTNGKEDVFLRDRRLAITERVNVETDGTEAPPSVFSITFNPAMSDDGRFVSFREEAALVLGDTNTQQDIYLRDRQGLGTPIVGYCTAKTNSGGCVPVIGATGLPSASGSWAFYLTAVKVLSGKSGVFFWSLSPGASAFGGGTLCVQPPIVRTAPQSSGGSTACTGAYVFPFDAAYMSVYGLSAGQTVYGQFWSRDPGFSPPNDIGLTDAIAFTVAP